MSAIPTPKSTVQNGDLSRRSLNASFRATPKYRRLSYSLNPSPSSSSLSALFLRNPNGSSPYPKPFSPVMQWQDITVEMEVDAPASVAYKLSLDRESVPRWMPSISSVEVFKDKPDLTRWSVKYKALGQNIEYSWLAKYLQPIPNRKIHWVSLEGLPSRGGVRIFPRGPSSCLVEMTFSYEVPPLLLPFASAMKPLQENLIRRGLERFATLVKSI